MPALQVPPGAENFVLRSTIGAYSDEAYTNAKKISTTAVVGGNSLIDKNTETFVGQMRWFTPMNPVINIASITDPTDGLYNDFASEFSQYIKTARTWGAKRRNLSELITKVDDIKQMSKSFGEHRAQDEDNAVRAVLKGVAVAEILHGAGTAGGGAGKGGQTFYNDPNDKKFGFYVDLGNDKLVEDRGSYEGAARAEAMIRAVGMAYKDYEPDYMYWVIDPAVRASIRSANLIDGDKVVDGDVEFETVFNGKFRLLHSRADTSFSPEEIAALNGGGGVDIVGRYTSYLILPGAIAMEQLDIPNPVGVDNREASYHGTGVAEIWHRWGFVIHPGGYTWAGDEEHFPTNQDYASVRVGSTTKRVADLQAGDHATVKGVWQRKTASVLSLGILPVFHG